MQIAQLRHARFGYEYFIHEIHIIIIHNIKIITDRNYTRVALFFKSETSNDI